ncbi:MAG TPA: hypothetical protein DD766_00195 [Desulfovibrio sp.]|nr:hypothetical protein [Desulfovibrio sp.]
MGQGGSGMGQGRAMNRGGFCGRLGRGLCRAFGFGRAGQGQDQTGGLFRFGRFPRGAAQGQTPDAALERITALEREIADLKEQLRNR